MSTKPIFCCTHPRACSTAFERVFMTRRDILKCLHEPFGDAFYYGPERMSTRFADDEEGRKASGFSETTYENILERIERESSEGKRLFIKDMIYYIVPPKDQPPVIAPSLEKYKRGIGTLANDQGGADKVGTPYPWHMSSERNNPTIVPAAILTKFHWIFLIRDPHKAVPSYYRCTIPPLDEVTGFFEFDPSESGYKEVRKAFDYLRSIRAVGPHTAKGHLSGEADEEDAHDPKKQNEIEICVLDADDILDEPAPYIEACCDSVGIPYTPRMLEWDNEEDQRFAREAFEKWKGFHEDVLDSTGLNPRQKSHTEAARAEEDWDREWEKKYGSKAAKVIRETVDATIADYLYLKKFALSH